MSLSLPTGRRNSIAAGALSLMLLAVTTIVAVRTDGYRASHVDLNDASVWISGDNVPDTPDKPSQIGRVNTEIDKLNVNIGVEGHVTLYQEDDSTYYVSGNQVTPVDAATQATLSPVSVPSGSSIAIGGGTAAVLAPTGDLWVMPVASLATYAKGSSPQTRVAPNSLVVVGSDGVAYTYHPGDGGGSSLGLTGSKHDWSLPHPTVKTRVGGVADAATDADSKVELTVVGSTPVVLDRSNGQIVVAGGAVRSISGDDAQLQQPGPDSSSAVVATSRGLMSVPLSGGAPVQLRPTGSQATQPLSAGASGAARPVIVQGCVYGAWATEGWEQRVCPQQPQYGYSGSLAGGASGGGALVFRVNHDRVLVNDISNGAAWDLSKAGKSTKVSGWEHPKKDLDNNADDKRLDQPEPQRKCSDKTDAPLTAPTVDNFGARVGVPVSLSLAQIPGVQASRCRVVAFDTPKFISAPPNSTLQLSADHSSMQFTLAATGTASVSYTVGDGFSQSPAGTINITVYPYDGTNDQAPSIKKDRKPTFVVAGGSVSYNALTGMADPEGDPLLLVDACVGTGCLDTPYGQRDATKGAVQFRPDGWIKYSPPQAASGTQTLNFTVADSWGKTVNDSERVQIIDPKIAVPVTHDTIVRAVQGQTTKVDVLAADVSPSGGTLSLVSFAPSSESSGISAADAATAVTLGDNNDLVVQPKAPLGTILIKYQVSDSNSTKQADGFARIDVVKADTQPVPVAMMDSAVARSGSQVLVDATANDYDTAGNVLVVQSATIADGGADDAKAQLLDDRHTVRITPPSEFVKGHQPIIVNYVVSNGFHPASGQIVVSPFPSTQVLRPFTSPSGPVSVRAGMMTAISVLQNDVDPQGLPLRLTTVNQPTNGHAYIDGDQIRYVADAPNFVGTVEFHYGVTDAPAGVESNGQDATGDVIVNVEPKNANHPPDQLALTARAVQGSLTHISVPLLSADPDGDIVGIGAITSPPKHGIAQVVGDGFKYTPSTATGAVGTDEFSFSLTDGQNYSTSTVRVGVVAQTSPSRAVATPITVVVLPGHSRLINLLDPNFVTSTSEDLRVQTTGKGKASLTKDVGSIGPVTSDGAVTYRAPSNVAKQVGTTLSYVIQNSGGSTTNQVLITVDPNMKPQDPVVHDQFHEPAYEGERVTVDLLKDAVDPSGSDPKNWKVELGGDKPSDLVVSQGKVSFTMPNESIRFSFSVPAAKLGAPRPSAIVSVPLNRGVTCDNIPTIDVAAGASTSVDVLRYCKHPPGEKIDLLDSPQIIPDGIGSASVNKQTHRVDLSVSKLAPSGDYQLSSRLCIDSRCPNTTYTASATLRVDGVDTPPKMHAQVSVPADGQANVNLTDWVYDPNPGDQQKVKFSQLTPSSNNGVAASLAGSTLTLNADVTATGRTAVFQVHLDDTHGAAGQATGTITVTVTSSNDAPIIAPNQSFTMTQTNPPSSQSFDVLALVVNASSNGQQVPVELKSPLGQPGSGVGTAGIVGGKIQFTPNPTFGGQAIFSYTVQQPSDTTRQATGTVTINVIGFPLQPSAPSGLSNEIQSRIVGLGWQAVDGHGGSIDHYTVQCQVQGGEPCLTPSLSTQIASIAYTPLDDGVTYRFRVAAHNEAGDGPWSDWSTPWTPDQGPATPSITQVGNFDGHNGGDGTQPPGALVAPLTVTWTEAPFEGTCPSFLLHVGAQAVSVAGPANQGGHCPGGTFSKQVTNLTVGAQQSPITVDATNRVGTVNSGPAACDPGLRNCTPKTAPGPVQALQVTQVPGSTNLQVSWGPPDPGGDLPTNIRYSMTCTVASSSCNQAGATTSPVTIPVGSNVGSTFTVTVTASNSAGSGTAATASSLPAGGKPSSVGSVTATPGNTSATLSFAPLGVSGGSPVSYWVSTNGGTFVSFGTAVPITVGSLNPGSAYTFAVRACNNWSGSNISDCSDPATSNQVTTLTYSGTASFSSTPTNGYNVNGGPCINCYFTNLTINGFAPGQTYRFYCRTNVAVNSTGFAPDGSDWADLRVGPGGTAYYGGTLTTDSNGSFTSGTNSGSSTFTDPTGKGNTWCGQAHPNANWIAGFEIDTPEFPNGIVFSTNGNRRPG